MDPQIQHPTHYMALSKSFPFKEPSKSHIESYYDNKSSHVQRT